MTALHSRPQTVAPVQLLHFFDSALMRYWDVATNLGKGVWHSPHPVVPLRTVLTQRKEAITINDDTLYKRCRVQWYGDGIALRDTVPGHVIKTKKQYPCRPDDFLVAEIDAKDGGFGIVPPDLAGAIVSSHYFLFEIDQAKLLPAYLGLFVKTNQFMGQVQAVGSTNYSAVRPHNVLEYLIALPPLAEQARLVAEHDRQLREAERKRAEAVEARANVEVSFLHALGLEMPKALEKKQGWQMVESQHLLDRWDYFAIGESETAGIIKSKYPLRPLGLVYNFVSRGWSEHKGDTFRYIEIASVEPDLGITGAKKLATKDAPSRASQVVKEGDLIIATTRPYLKKFALVETDFANCVCSSGFSIIAASPEYDLLFLREFLFSVYGVSQIRDKMTGALYPAITNEALKSIRIPLPPTVVEQQLIIAAVEQQRTAALQLENHATTLEAAAKATFEAAIFA